MKRDWNCKHPCRNQLVQPVLNFAPCPPPMLSNVDFYDHALSRNLSHLDVCSIMRRCRPANSEVKEGCRTPSVSPPFIIIIGTIVWAIPFLAFVCFLMKNIHVHIHKRRKKKKNECQQHNVHDSGHASADIQMAENESSRNFYETAKPEEHNRAKSCCISSDNMGNDSCDLETKSVSVVKQVKEDTVDMDTRKECEEDYRRKNSDSISDCQKISTCTAEDETLQESVLFNTRL